MTEIHTKRPKIQKTEDQKYCFVPIIRSNLHLVNFEVLIEKSEKNYFIWSFGNNIQSYGFYLFGHLVSI